MAGASGAVPQPARGRAALVGRRALPALAALLLALATTAAAAPRVESAPASGRQARLDDYVDRLAAFGFSGQIVVAESGQVVLDRACGWADRRFQVPMTPATRLAVGSITKNFVAAALLRLEAQGRLRLDDRLRRHLPEAPPEWEGVRLDQLLTHTAGVARDVPDGVERAPRDELVKRILALPPAAPPGERFVYSNAGFDLAAAVVERVAGTPFGTFVAAELLVPAGLASSGIAGTPALEHVPAARGYDEWKETAAWAEWPPGWSGTGSGRLVSTARDLMRWLDCARLGRVLTPAQWDRMAAALARMPDGGAYGLAMRVDSLPEGRTVRRIGGSVAGYHAEARLYPEDDRIVVVTTNQDHFARAEECQVIANGLSLIARGREVSQPPPARAGDDGSAGGVVGAWDLPGGSRIEIWEESGRLRLGARGQEAIDLFDPDRSDSTGARRRALQRTEVLMRALAADDTALAARVLTPEELAFGWPALHEQLKVRGILYQGLLGITGLGVVAHPPGGFLSSYVSLRFVDRTEDLALRWWEGRLSDVVFGEARPFPVLLPVAAVAPAGYAAFDLFRHHAVPIAIREGAEGRRLVLGPPGGEREAIRVR